MPPEKKRRIRLESSLEDGDAVADMEDGDAVADIRQEDIQVHEQKEDLHVNNKDGDAEEHAAEHIHVCLFPHTNIYMLA